MILKQLKQLTLSGRLRNVVFGIDVARFYGSPAVCHSLTTSKAPRKLSREDRRAAVESFITEYRETNDGKFPTLKATHKAVGGGYYSVRDIFQELKLKPIAPLPIVAKGLSEVSPSVPNDTSSQTLNGPQSHVSACNPKHISPVVVDPVLQTDSIDTIETGSDQKQATIDSSDPNTDEINLQGNNLVITATHEKSETETAPNNDVECEWNSSVQLTESQKSIVVEECLRSSETEGVEIVVEECLENSETEEKEIVVEECQKRSETEGEENLTHLVIPESKADHLEGAAVSENVVPTETRQVSERGTGEVETGERASAWSNIMSFAKDFANFWRKG